jgi:hypothetical protein
LELLDIVPWGEGGIHEGSNRRASGGREPPFLDGEDKKVPERQRVEERPKPYDPWHDPAASGYRPGPQHAPYNDKECEG